MNPVFVRSHVERCVQDALGVCRPVTDDDGDWPFRVGTAACFVRLHVNEHPMVEVFAVAAHGVRRSARLLTEINDVNARTRTARVVHACEQVLVTQTMLASACTSETLSQACQSVSHVANDMGVMIAVVFGGGTPFPAELKDAALGEAS
jgi:hypothetical protein